MEIESSPHHQQSNGDLVLLPSPADGPVHPQSTESQPYPTLGSRTHPPYPTLGSPTHPISLDDSSAIMRLILHDRRRCYWWTGEEEEEEEVDYEVQREEEELNKALKCQEELAATEMMSRWADRCQMHKEDGSLFPPPLKMSDYPDLFERAWGWDTILPYDVTDDWSRYKAYLSSYFDHIAATDGDNCNDKTSLAHSCIKLEEHLLYMWDKCSRKSPADDLRIRLVSGWITKHAREMTSGLKVDLPAVVAVALKCIIEEADLMCAWLMSGTDASMFYICMSNEIRLCALCFMHCNGFEHVMAMATMMGTMKEAKVVSHLLREYGDMNASASKSLFIRGHTLGVMLDLCYEHSTMENSTGVSTAEECSSTHSSRNLKAFNHGQLEDEIGSETGEAKKDSIGMSYAGELLDVSADTNGCETKLVKDHEEKDKNCAMEYGEKVDSLVEIDDMNHTEIGSESGKVGRYNTMERKKLQLWLDSCDEDDEDFVVKKEDDKKSPSNENSDDRKDMTQEDKRWEKNSGSLLHKKRKWNTGFFSCLKPGRVIGNRH